MGDREALTALELQLNPVVHYWAALRSLSNGKAPAS